MDGKYLMRGQQKELTLHAFTKLHTFEKEQTTIFH